MKIETHGTKTYLCEDTGILHVPGTLYLNDTYINPHSTESAAKAIRIWIRFAEAFSIDLAARTLQGTWLTETEKKTLASLVFRPIEEIESMSDRAIRKCSSATMNIEPKRRNGAVASNTAIKRIVGISDFLQWFYKKILEPRIPKRSARQGMLKDEIESCGKELKKKIGSTKSLHPFRIRSLPIERFLKIYSEIYLKPAALFKTNSGKISKNQLRDRAIALLACEGLRPGAIGNLALQDFKWPGKDSAAYIAINDNTARRSKPVSTGTPVQKGASSNQAYNSELVISIWPATAQAIKDYIDGPRKTVTTRGLYNRSEGFLFLADHGGPINDRGTIENIFKRVRKGLLESGLLLRDQHDPYQKGETYELVAYVLRHSSASLFYSEKSREKGSHIVTDEMKERFGWSAKSKMPHLYARRAMTNAADLVVNDFMTSILADAKMAKSAAREHYE